MRADNVRSRTGRRRGMAPVELTLSLPILVAMTALILVMARGMLARSEAAVAARYQAWKKAAGHRSEHPLDLGQRRGEDVVGGSVVRRFEGANVLPAQSLAAESEHWVM